MNTINSIHKNILEKIESGAIRQKPRWHFVIMTLSIVFGFVALSLIFFYLISFVALLLREDLIFEALSFGPRTVFAMMHTLPFLLIVILITVLLLLHVLVRYFAFAYMRPVALTLGVGFALTILIFAGVLTLDKGSRIARFGEDGHVPGLNVIHSQFRDRRPPMALRGVIGKVEDNVLTIRENSGREVVIVLSERTRVDKELYSQGDRVMVLLERSEEMLRAIAIRTEHEFSGATSTQR